MQLFERFKAWFRRNISDVDPHPEYLSNLDRADRLGLCSEHGSYTRR